MRTNFLVALSGAQPEILDQCPTERLKFQSLGLAVLITSLTAMVSMWFALTGAVGLNIAVAFPVAFVWGIVILGIDRLLVVSVPIEGSRRIAIAMPRLLLAGLLGLLIGTPLVLRVFQADIDLQIVVIKQQHTDAFLVTQQKSILGRQISIQHTTVNNLEQIIDSDGTVVKGSSGSQLRLLTGKRSAEHASEQQYYRQWACQLYGGPGCLPPDNGPSARTLQLDYQRAAAQVATLTTDIKQIEKASASTASNHSRYQQAIAALPEVQKQLSAYMTAETGMLEKFEKQNNEDNGLLMRLQALNELSSQNATINESRILLFILFSVIECLPIAVKLLQRQGIYEQLFKAAVYRELKEAKRARRRAGAGATLDLAEIWRRPAPSATPLRWRVDDSDDDSPA